MIAAIALAALVPQQSAVDVDVLAGPGFGGAVNSTGVYFGGTAAADVDYQLSWFYFGGSVYALGFASSCCAPVVTAGIGPHVGAIFGADSVRLFGDIGVSAQPFLVTATDGGGTSFLVLPAGQARVGGDVLRPGAPVRVRLVVELTVAASGSGIAFLPAVLVGAAWHFPL